MSQPCGKLNELALADQDTFSNVDTKYAKFAKYAKYAKCAKYANYAKYAEFARYAEFAKSAKAVNNQVRSAFGNVFTIKGTWH